VPVNWWVDKTKHGTSIEGIIIQLYHACVADTCYSIDEPWKHYTKWEKLDRKGHIVWFHSYKISRVGTSMKTEGRLVVAREQENREVGSDCSEVQVFLLAWRKCSRIGQQWYLHNFVNIIKTHQDVHFKLVKMVNFLFVDFIWITITKLMLMTGISFAK
jgi:hypothetical protein